MGHAHACWGAAELRRGGGRLGESICDPVLLCRGCYHGYSCSNRGTRAVVVYMSQRDGSWTKVLANEEITGDIFVSFKPGGNEELNALVVDLHVGNRGCPTRIMPTASQQSWEARSCVVRWNGTGFTYKPL